MDKAGPAECRANRESIAEWVREKYGEQSIIVKLKYRWRAIATGIAWKIKWKDPVLFLVDEAIRLAMTPAEAD